MRFSEKSFEIRFCASLSAALMPFNRNPQWFGLTQAQERKAGIDAMLRRGGRLIVFQFKACRRVSGYPTYLLEKEQWDVLSNVARHHPNSTFYVFPEAQDIRTANSYPCLIEKSWWTNCQDLAPFFPTNSPNTRTLTLDSSNKRLYLNGSSNPAHVIKPNSGCALFGCFCQRTQFIIHRHTMSDETIAFLLLRSDPVDPTLLPVSSPFS
ncbi:hypothetical protein MIT9_P0143 [Methylomarinovum caldicuralii]|uniref:Uncharacterized protein n=1 Tax=Methylomarinovum caldicuralii TaxID=438856 RepID=A0AAU9CCA8_9GAMM|nr:hypothetical protein MIT9_P0143 [Methylomarinovum caldicuralii]